MKFGLDFDGTVTAAPELWAMFIRLAKSLDHEVKIVTARHMLEENRDVFQFALDSGVNVIFTDGGPKSDYYDADVWIDDNPIMIPSVEAMRACCTLGL